MHTRVAFVHFFIVSNLLASSAQHCLVNTRGEFSSFISLFYCKLLFFVVVVSIVFMVVVVVLWEWD